FTTAVPGGAGNIQVRPGGAFGKARQETGGRGGTGQRAADVGDVGKVGIQQFLIIVFQGQTPDFVAAVRCCLLQFAGQGFIGGEQTGIDATQSGHTGAGEGGDIDQTGWVEGIDAVGHGVTQHQTAFGVGV